MNVAEKGDSKEIPMDINVAHVLLNHPRELLLRTAAKAMRWKLSGQLKLCTACLRGKAK